MLKCNCIAISIEDNLHFLKVQFLLMNGVCLQTVNKDRYREVNYENIFKNASKESFDLCMSLK